MLGLRLSSGLQKCKAGVAGRREKKVKKGRREECRLRQGLQCLVQQVLTMLGPGQRNNLMEVLQDKYLLNVVRDQRPSVMLERRVWGGVVVA